jgi:transposase
MKKSRKYRATDVKNVLVDRVLAASPEGAATAGIDISKFEAWTVMRWRDGSFERPWKAKIPSQMDELVAALRRIGQQRPLIVAMESTGTYGDALRARLTAAGLEVHRVGGKAAHDYAEIFDGVPRWRGGGCTSRRCGPCRNHRRAAGTRARRKEIRTAAKAP